MQNPNIQESIILTHPVLQKFQENPRILKSQIFEGNQGIRDLRSGGL